MATFAGVSAYMLAVVRRIPQPGSVEPVPRLAITVGMVLFLVCVGVVAYYAQHITHSIRVSSAMDRVVDDALRIGNAGGTHDVVDHDAVPEPPDHSRVVPASDTGYMQGVDMDALVQLAVERGLVIRLRPMVGDPVVQGGPLAWVWTADADGAGAAARDIDDGLRERIGSAAQIGGNRTLDRDFTYGLRQLVDVAIRAMSPSLNDPYTAVEAIDHLTTMLCRLAERPLGARVRRDDGRIVVAQPGPDLLTCVELACDQIRRYGGHEPAVAVRLLILLREVAVHAHHDMRSQLHAQVQRVVDHAETAAQADGDVRVVRAAADTASAWIDGNVVPDEVAFARL